MKLKKLKKYLSVAFLSDVYFNSSLFVIGEKKSNFKTLHSYTFLKVLTKKFFSEANASLKSFKYPLYIKFFNSFSDMQKGLAEDSKFVFVNLREFFFKTEYLIFKNSISFKNSFSHIEFFLKKDKLFLSHLFS